MNRAIPALRAAFLILALLAPAMGYLARAMGQGYGAATALTAIQAGALGFAAASLLPAGRRWWGSALCCLLLAAIWLGDAAIPGGGLLAAPGLAHAILYAGLLLLFGSTLRPGRASLVTRIAARLNPSFHAAMVPYTRKVTWAWCLFFGLQLVLSAGLLTLGWMGPWLLLVGTLHLPLTIGFMLGEYAVRRWRFRHEHVTSLREMVGSLRLHVRL